MEVASGSAKRDGKALQSAEGHVQLPLELLRRELEVRQAAEDRLERDLAGDPREGGAGAVVDPVAEGDVLVRPAPEVEAVGLRELVAVAVRGSQHDEHLLPLLDPLPAHLKGLGRLAADELERA